MYNNPGYGGYYGNMMQGPPMPMNSGKIDKMISQKLFDIH